MINIDDFVREKLGGQPEMEDPTAWLRMKALLDKEMPEKAVPFYFRWGKPMAFLGAALLLAGLCVGGFEITKAIRAKNDGAEIANTPRKTEITSSSSSVTNSTIANRNSPTTNNPTNITDSEESKQELNTNISESHSATHKQVDLEEQKAERVDKKSHSAVASSSNSNSLSSKTVISNSTSSSQIAENKIASNHGDITTTAMNGKKKAAEIAIQSSLSTNEKSGYKENSKSNNKDLVADNRKKLNDKLYAPDHNNAAIKKRITHANNPSVGDKIDDKQSAAQLPKPSRTKENWASNAQSPKSVVSDKGNTKDSIPYTNIVQKSTLSKKFPRSITTLVDTQAKGKIALPEIAATDLKLDSKDAIVTKSQDLKSKEQPNSMNEYAASLNSKNTAELKKDSSVSSDAAPLVLKDTKKSKKKSLWEMLNLPEATANAKKDLSNAKFYAGFSGGFNYSISKTNNFQGVQFGPTGELVFNKNWSLFGAIRYFNRSGGKKTINDSYSKEVSNGIIDSTKGANYFFTVLTDSSSRHFNFSTVHSFELPLTVRYTINKFYLMTGINLAYSLPVNVELVHKDYKNLNAHAISTNTTKPILKETAPVLSTSDFGSRFGLGYVFGAGYQISPSWQTDLRVVNTFWDNAKGSGANKLSKDFYKIPSVQISVGYQFNRSRVKPTYGPTSTAP